MLRIFVLVQLKWGRTCGFSQPLFVLPGLSSYVLNFTGPGDPVGKSCAVVPRPRRSR